MIIVKYATFILNLHHDQIVDDMKKKVFVDFARGLHYMHSDTTGIEQNELHSLFLVGLAHPIPSHPI